MHTETETKQNFWFYRSPSYPCECYCISASWTTVVRLSRKINTQDYIVYIF